MSRASLASLLLLCASTLGACGGGPPVRAPDAPVTVAPPPIVEAPRPSAPTARPDKTSVWVHLEDPAMLVLMLSALKDGAKTAGVPTDEYTTFLETIDLRRPIDAAVALHKKKDVDAAVRLTFRDSKAFFKLLATKYTLREEGDRIRIAKKDGAADLDAKPEDENANDVVVCEFEARASDTAVCGNAHGVEIFRDWLRTGPRPSAETKRSKSPIVQAVAYAAGLRKLFERELADDKGDDADQLRRFAEDAESLALEVGRDGLSIELSAQLQLRSSTSKVVADLLTPMSTEPAPEAFFQLSEETSAALFSPGGGPLPRWVDQLMSPEKSTPSSTRAKADAASAALAKLFGRPFAAAYGVHIDRAKAAVAAVRAAKDPAKEKKVLDKALDAYGTFLVSADIATVERTTRELIAVDAATEAAKAAEAAKEAKAVKNKGGHQTTQPPPMPKSTQVVRVATAKLGLPKGSFFVDDTKPDVLASYPQGLTKGAGPTKYKMKTESTLFVAGAGGTTWGFLGDDEKTLVESAKKTLAAPPSKSGAASLDPMLRQPGMVVGGYLSSQVGAFAMHSISSLLSTSGSGSLNDDLAELEKDLAATRMPIPFALTANKRGEGGVIRFEVKGQPEAFKMVAEHLGGAATGAAALLLYAVMLAGP